MYRKNYLWGCCLCSFGTGLILGHSLSSWLLCWIGGLGLILLGICILQKK